MTQVLWPDSDRGVLLQVVTVVLLTTSLAMVVRRERALVMLAAGVGMCLLGFIGLRTVH